MESNTYLVKETKLVIVDFPAKKPCWCVDIRWLIKTYILSFTISSNILGIADNFAIPL